MQGDRDFPKSFWQCVFAFLHTLWAKDLRKTYFLVFTDVTQVIALFFFLLMWIVAFAGHTMQQHITRSQWLWVRPWWDSFRRLRRHAGMNLSKTSRRWFKKRHHPIHPESSFAIAQFRVTTIIKGWILHNIHTDQSTVLPVPEVLNGKTFWQ